MSKTSPELAQKIVDLLLNDPGVADSWSIQRVSPEESRPLEEQVCVGCKEQFMPKAVGRQFCSQGMDLKAGPTREMVLSWARKWMKSKKKMT